MNDAILVTGASGFIGGRLAPALKSAGYRVYCHSQRDGNIASCPLEYEDVAHVYHLAGKTFVPESWEKAREFYEVNVLGAANVLEFCRRRQASLTLLSSYVYGKPQRLPIGEDHAVEAFNPYGHSKILAEEIGQYYRTQFGVRVCIIRPFNLYGPGQDDRFLIPTLIRQALDPACDRIVVADIRPRRDFVHVRDLIDLLLKAKDRGMNAVYNAGSGRSVSIGDLAGMIAAVAPPGKPVVSEDKRRPDEVLDVVADITRAARDLDWSPRISLADGLRDTIEWIKHRPAAGG
jgi:nucleoside-diphosphate-sugar epimerase